MSYNRRTLAPDSPFAIIAAIMMFVSAAVRTVYFAFIVFSGIELWQFALHYLLPVGCCLIMGVMLLMRKNNLMPTIIPMIMGVAFFALKSVEFELWHCVLCCVLYAAFAVVYILTVSGTLGTRALLLALSGLPLLFHIFVEDIFITKWNSFTEFLPEISVLLIMASLFVEALGMRRGRIY